MYFSFSGFVMLVIFFLFVSFFLSFVYFLQIVLRQHQCTHRFDFPLVVVLLLAIYLPSPFVRRPPQQPNSLKNIIASNRSHHPLLQATAETIAFVTPGIYPSC